MQPQQPTDPAPVNASPLPLSEIEFTVLRLRDEARLGFTQIGRQLEVSSARANQIYRGAQAKQRDFATNGSRALCLLPARARRILAFCELKTWAETRAAMEAGELYAKCNGGAVFWLKLMIPSISRKTWEVLYDWAGRPQIPPGV
jgi:hypothetical protein